jgi:hypothetical protein
MQAWPGEQRGASPPVGRFTGGLSPRRLPKMVEYVPVGVH